jgi:hypothetical protein
MLERMRSLPMLALALGAVSCAGGSAAPGALSVIDTSVAGPGCTAEPSAIGRVDEPELDEISGVVESRADPRVLFVHNDSGDSPRFFAIDRRGRLLAELSLETVPVLLDAEDIAIGPGVGGGHFIYLGDTGNNFASFGFGIPRRTAVLYRVAEPAVPLTSGGAKLELYDAFRIVLRFPDGARDVEAFFIEPTSGELYLLTKQDDGRSQLLTASAAMLAASGGELRLLGEIRLGEGSARQASMPTAASISGDGRMILIRTYSTVLLFRRAAGESILTALSRAPERLPPPREAQGEAITWVDRDTAFITISEGPRPLVHCAQVDLAILTK